jgi:hypothetical protein
MDGLSLAFYATAQKEMIHIVEEWGSIPLRTAEVGDYAARFLAAEVHGSSAYSLSLTLYQRSLKAAAGATNVIPVELRKVLEHIRGQIRGYVIEPWLDRFPGFVSDLENRLHAYATALHIAEERASEDNEGANVDPRTPLLGLLYFLHFSHKTGQLSDDDYEWNRERANRALSELRVPSSRSAIPPAPAPMVTRPSPPPSDVSAASSRALSRSSSFVDLAVLCKARSKTRIVCSSEATVEVCRWQRLTVLF